HVAGDVNTINGGISLLDGTVVAGDVVVRKPKRVGWKFGRKKPIPVEIGGDAEVHGKLIFEQAVELRVHPGATYGEVIGGEVTVVEL
ncbi:MAG: hypothetical protein R3348_08545, partial [Xanthomonadales bacterium]|nr:hypothetical protein [Xanthomonadales bacterium]